MTDLHKRQLNKPEIAAMNKPCIGLWFGFVVVAVGWFVLVWAGLLWFGLFVVLVWYGLGWFGLVWVGLGWFAV